MTSPYAKSLYPSAAHFEFCIRAHFFRIPFTNGVINHKNQTPLEGSNLGESNAQP